MSEKTALLVVDDEPRYLQSLALILRNDFRVLTAANGLDGVRVFEREPTIPIILLDLDMPVMSDYLRRFKIMKGKNLLLRQPGLSVREISARVGIDDSKYFCRIFREETGLTPSEFRRRSCSAENMQRQVQVIA